MNASNQEVKVPRIMLVDDEEAILGALRRLFRQDGYHVDTFVKPMDALAHMVNQPYDLVISDMRMPEMDGASFLQAVAVYAPNTMRLLLTGYADQDSTVRAINLGRIHGYLNKPWDNVQLREQVASSLKLKAEKDKERQSNSRLKHLSLNLNNAKKNLELQLSNVRSELDQASSFLDCAHQELKENFHATIQVLSQIVRTRLLNDEGISQLVINQCGQLLERINCNDDAKLMIGHAAQLCQIGKLALPDVMLSRPIYDLSTSEREIYDEYVLHGEQWLFPVPALHGVATIIRHHQEHYDGSGAPDGLTGAQIPLGSRLLKIVLDFNLLLMGKLIEDISTPDDAADYMYKHSGTIYDPELLEIFLDLPNNLAQYDELCGVHICDTSKLVQGMVICRDLVSRDGLLLLVKGAVLTQSMIHRLRQWEMQHGVGLSLVVKRADLHHVA